MLVILEGTDGAGKTTYARELHRTWLHLQERQQRGTYVSLHKGPPDSRPILHQYELDLERHLLQVLSETDLVICDRWHVGELIYGPRFRGHSELSGEQATHVDLLLDACGAVKIVIEADEELLRSRLDASTHLPGLTLDHAVAINGLYRLWYSNGGMWSHVRASRMFTHHQLEVTLEHAKLRAARARYLHTLAPGYVGSLWPSILLVGDRLGDGKLAAPEYCRAFTPGRVHSSAEYLMTAIMAIPEWDGRLGIVNANDEGTRLEELAAEFRQHYRNTVMIALGNNASRALTERNVAHLQVPHPQWWRRFQYGQVREYSEVMRAAARQRMLEAH